MKARHAAERLRLLYSWRECLASRGAPPKGRDAIALRRAEREIAAHRKRIEREIARLGDELQHAFAADQQRPGNLVIEEKLGKLRHTIGQFTHVMKAATSADLGGMVELPAEHYPIELGLGGTAGAFEFGRDDFITLGVAALTIVASCLAITWYSLWREDVDFGVDRPGPGRIAVNFQNNSAFVASFYGPWPESEAVLARRGYGIRLYCRARGSETFQDCTNIRDVWSYQGQSISPLKPVQVETGVAVTVLLHLPALEKEYGEDVDAVIIECGNRGNRDDFSFSVSLEE